MKLSRTKQVKVCFRKAGLRSERESGDRYLLVSFLTFAEGDGGRVILNFAAQWNDLGGVITPTPRPSPH